MFQYYYHNDPKNYSFYITDETKRNVTYTFGTDGSIWESKSISIFYSLIDPNKSYNIIDVGAQAGLYSLYAKFLPNSTFYSFEPFKETYNYLVDNLKLNNITNVNTYNIGLSDKKDDNVIFNTCISHNGLNTLGTNVLRFKDVKQELINIDTIDNLFYDKGIKVDFIKIDTEGHEYFILKGAEKTIQNYKPIIQIEYNPINMNQCNITPEMLDNLIIELNYKKINLTDEELIIAPNDYPC
jgi:FkbM family methyltransferase